MSEINCKIRGKLTSAQCYICYERNEVGFSEAMQPKSRVLCKREQEKVDEVTK